MPDLDPRFCALPLDALADAALQRAAVLGATHADVRIEQVRSGTRSLRDGQIDSTSDETTLGLGVRVVHDGCWGFAAGTTLTTGAAAALAEQAVAVARVSRPLTDRVVELAPEPVHVGDWVSCFETDPFEVTEEERIGRLRELSDQVQQADGVDHVRAWLEIADEHTYYADSAGTRTRQRRVRTFPELEAVSTACGYSSMRSCNPPAGRGWEYLASNQGWDFDSEAAQLPDWLAEHVAAPSVEPGRYDLVVDPTNLWLTIHESVAHGTELDRALGYEAAYAGTSFATADGLGSLRYGSDCMTVTGDRVTEHGLASCGWDDEGVAAQRFDLIRDGVLVGYQLNRQMAAEQGLERSNGCAFASSGSQIPLQRMPNVSLQPADTEVSVADLVGQVENGLYVVGDKSWSIDMQRYNFQFTGQRFYRIRNGRLQGQVRDAAYQATTTDFWGSMTAVGGPGTYRLMGALDCGKGQPGQRAPVSHGTPAALFRAVNVLSTEAEGGR
ncbi:MAG: TldD/PmbA family protein [Actinomycetia bacterium]|nr:TldD/PmbA family protein [Actinomycetes bacterium]